MLSLVLLASTVVSPLASATDGQAGSHLRFDFGGAAGPVEPGYTAVTATSLYRAEVGHGFVSLDGLITCDRRR